MFTYACVLQSKVSEPVCADLRKAPKPPPGSVRCEDDAEAEDGNEADQTRGDGSKENPKRKKPKN